MAQSGKLTKAHMEKGIDENGNRIKLFTSALTSERAVQAGVGSFRYEGGTTTGKHQRLHANNLANDQARHGFGECVYDSGASYKGEWVSDRRQGRGVFTYSCGDQYEGEWQDGKYHGKGKYTSKSGGDVYEGEWQRDRCEGRGEYKYVESGDQYTGQFVSGLREGKGVYVFSNGNVYEGSYQHGQRHGVGVFHYSTGEAEVGNYSAGVDTGEGARWDAARTAACRLRNGATGEAISLGEAAAIAARLGTSVPARRLAGVKAAATSPDTAASPWSAPAPTANSESAPPVATGASPLVFGTDGRVQW